MEAYKNIYNYKFNSNGIKNVSMKIENPSTTLPNRAFSSCSALTSIVIPNYVTSIGDRTFWNCTGLTSAVIGNAVTSIGKNAFEYCAGLTSITIPDSVISIGQYAFCACSGLTLVKIGNSVTSIGSNAFESCSRLMSVEVGNSVTSINSTAFLKCSGLTSIVWNAVNYPDISSLSSNPFYNIRTQITSFEFGNNVKYIPKNICYEMSNLTSVVIPNSVTSIGEYAFASSGLTSITIPNSVISIGSAAFLDCLDLTSVGIGNSVTSIDFFAFASCLKLDSFIWNAINYPDISSYTNSPFYSMRSEIYSFKFGDSVEHIPAYLCYGIRSSSITIPNSVTSIGSNVFLNCSNLASVVITAITPPTLGSSVFSSTHSSLQIYVPDSSVDAYKTAPNWSTYADKIKPLSEKPA